MDPIGVVMDPTGPINDDCVENFSSHPQVSIYAHEQKLR
jgi:hypothetical protein